MDLSIVIPCYNCENNILNIMSSLLLQNRQDFEVIFINDGSVDKTSDVIYEYILINNLNNFYLYNFNNQGAAKARQQGLEYARGEYVFFLDADDAVSPNFIETILELIVNKPDMIYFSSEIITSKPPFKKIAPKVTFTNNMIYHDRDKFLNDMFDAGNWTSAVWAYVFRRQLAICSQACFTQRNAHEDHLFTLRLVGGASTIRVIKDVLYYQKRTIGSLTNSAKDLKYISERFRSFEEAIFDMRNQFNSRSVELYKIWSLRSFLFLCFENVCVIAVWFITPKAYRKMWKYKTDFLEIVFSFIRNKIKRFL
ncbi:TPA: glycosyltransferase family 2 protein [Klebsiella quasipneumoniae subsp. similipneumoniae]|nr:glycosyltransferase family 2 protein [Klebsiella quasipneumoniae subsp. similipneumoniae]